MTDGARITLATTVGPGRLEVQQLCLASWVEAGFDVVALNTHDEARALAREFPGVRFAPVRRHGAAHVGRAVPWIWDAIEELASAPAAHVGLVNSDILLRDPGLRARLLARPTGAMVLGQRTDVDSPQGENAVPQGGGIDFFVFDRSFRCALADRPFFFGMPWWDFWLPTAAALAGIEVARLEHGGLMHVRHAQAWSHDSWLRGAREFLSFVETRLPARAAPWDANARRAVERFTWMRRRAGTSLGHACSSIVYDFVTACPLLASPERAAEPCAEIEVREQMGYTVDRLLPGVSSHNNDVRPFHDIPPSLLGKSFTQVVASRVSPIEVTFKTAGRIFVLAGTDWDGGRAMIRTLSAAGNRTTTPALHTDGNAGFEVFAVRGEAGARISFPTQVMLVAESIAPAGGQGLQGIASARPPVRANAHARVLLSVARLNCGGFSMFFQVLGHLRLAEELTLIPAVYFNRRVCFWNDAGENGARNAWEYYFRPVSRLAIGDLCPETRSLEDLDTEGLRRVLADRAVVRDDYLAADVGFAGRMDERQRAIGARLVAAYVRPRPEVLARVDDFFARELAGRDVVGVHYRGTDKVCEEPPTPFELYREALDQELARRPSLRIFAATDCAAFLARLEDTYPDRVIHTEAFRSRDGRPVHFAHAPSAGEVLVDVLLLARTRHLFHGVSNVSAAALVFNLDLPHTELAAARPR